MPELPEVETTIRGLKPKLVGARLLEAEIRVHSLRRLVPETLASRLVGKILDRLSRRGKYLLFHFPNLTMLIHLGMSGSLRIANSEQPVEKHDHLDFHFDNGSIMRFRDPRRFGVVALIEGDPQHFPLLSSLGVEPLSKKFDGMFLFQRSRKRRVSVKAFIMDQKIVVGIGNIYAAESLFHAGIRPQRQAGRVSLNDYCALAVAIKQVLTRAIRVGGTSLRDFIGGDGRRGYFQISLNVYGRGGAPCPQCASPLSSMRIAQRATTYCRKCQH